MNEKVKNMRDSRKVSILGVPYKRLWQRFIKKPTPSTAIKTFCWECSGFSLSGARKCENKECPLWLFRKGSNYITPEQKKSWYEKIKKHYEGVEK